MEDPGGVKPRAGVGGKIKIETRSAVGVEIERTDAPRFDMTRRDLTRLRLAAVLSAG